MKRMTFFALALLLAAGTAWAQEPANNLGTATGVAAQANGGIAATETARRSLIVAAGAIGAFALAVGAVNKDDDDPDAPTPPPTTPPPPPPPPTHTPTHH